MLYLDVDVVVMAEPFHIVNAIRENAGRPPSLDHNEYFAVYTVDDCASLQRVTMRDVVNPQCGCFSGKRKWQSTREARAFAYSKRVHIRLTASQPRNWIRLYH